MTFLLRSMLNADLNRKVKEADLFREWKPFVESDATCLRLVDRIDAKSKTLANILNGLTPHGNPELNAYGTRFMKFTQNTGVKLAASGLNEATYDFLSSRLEARALISLMSLERSQNYESLVVNWSNSLQSLNESSGLRDVIESVQITQGDLDELLQRARVSSQGLRYGKTPGQTNRIRLLLAIANDELLKLAPKQHANLRSYLETSKKIRGKEHPGYDIEHVGAVSTASLSLGEAVDSLGNLALFYSKDNRSAGAAPVEFKAESYGGSICYATKVLTAKPDQDKELESVIGKFRTDTVDAGHWGQESVDRRFEFYWSLFEAKIRRELVPTSPKP